MRVYNDHQHAYWNLLKVPTMIYTPIYLKKERSFSHKNDFDHATFDGQRSCIIIGRSIYCYVFSVSFAYILK